MLVIGLTGGIATGKSIVADLFAQIGTPVIDADRIARDVTTSDSPAFLDIMDHFEEPLIMEDGTLNRVRLRQIVFERPSERLWLENLLHPLILDTMQRQISKLDAPYVIAVIPLLLETGPHPFIHRILVVDATESAQRARITQRDKDHTNHIDAVLNAQINRNDRLAQADDVIMNDGELTHLLPQVEKLHQLYLSLAKK